MTMEIKFMAVIKDHGTYEVRKLIWDLEKPHDLMDVDIIMDDCVQSLRALFSPFPNEWKGHTTLLLNNPELMK